MSGVGGVDVLAVALAVGGACAVCLVACALRLCWVRRRHGGYSKVSHTLDRDEQRLKQSLEEQGAALGGLFAYDGTGDADDEFDTADIEKLQLLDEYEMRLMAAAQADDDAAGAGGGAGGGGDGSQDSSGSPRRRSPADASQAGEAGPGSAGDALGEMKQARPQSASRRRARMGASQGGTTATADEAV